MVALSLDYYGYFYPNVHYALESLRQGHGLLWNAFQNCGQPFYAISLSALLYPPHLLFLALPQSTAVIALLLANLLIAGIGQYLLCREAEMGEAAALAGAVTLQLGGMALFLASWTPVNLASYVWIPAAMFACERLLRRPSPAGSLLLGAALALQLLAGNPQVSLSPTSWSSCGCSGKPSPTGRPSPAASCSRSSPVHNCGNEFCEGIPSPGWEKARMRGIKYTAKPSPISSSVTASSGQNDCGLRRHQIPLVSSPIRVCRFSRGSRFPPLKKGGQGGF